MKTIKELFFSKSYICTNFKLNLGNKTIKELEKIDDQTLEKNKDFFNFVQRTVNSWTRPFIFYAGINNIEALDQNNIFIDEDLKKRIDKFGLNVYLLEPLSTYRTNDSFKSWYCEYNKEEDSLIKSYELDSIENFCKKNKLKYINVISAEHNVNYVFGKKYKKLVLNTKVLFWPFGVEGSDDDFDTSQITKKIWCGNKRYSVHRHIVASYLISKIPKNMLNISWFTESKIENLNNRVDLDFLQERKKLVMDGVERLDKLSPISVDIDLKSKTSIYKNYFIKDYNAHNTQLSYKESFCALVTETRFFQSTSLISEKIINPILCNKFFVIVGPPKTLHYLKSFGVKTFNDWIDESYDDELDHTKRILKILEIIDWINSKNIDELKEIYEQMRGVFSHNLQCARKYEKLWRKNELKLKNFSLPAELSLYDNLN